MTLTTDVLGKANEGLRFLRLGIYIWRTCREREVFRGERKRYFMCWQSYGYEMLCCAVGLSIEGVRWLYRWLTVWPRDMPGPLRFSSLRDSQLPVCTFRFNSLWCPDCICALGKQCVLFCTDVFPVVLFLFFSLFKQLSRMCLRLHFPEADHKVNHRMQIVDLEGDSGKRWESDGEVRRGKERSPHKVD